MDRRAEFEAYFRASFAPVAHTVFLILHDRQKAQDVTQEAFLQLLRHWRTVADYDRPDAWVRRVAIRLAVREVDRERARRAKERQASPPVVDCDIERSLPDPDVARAVAGLPPMQRAAVVLFYFEDLPVTEVASLLRISTSTAKQHLHRARHRLASLLHDEDQEVRSDAG